jgi:general secretion pathway protein J
VKERSPGEAGFTLIEVMISLGLFGLIAVAGLALVTGIINVQGRTDVRLERLAQLQRTMGVITGDLDQVAHGNIAGGGGEVSFTRAGPGAGGPPIPVRYALVEGAMVRFIGPRPQLLLPGVAQARWRFWDGQWTDRWPRDEKQAGVWPRAIEIEMQIASPGGPTGSLRRMVVLPVQADPPKPEDANPLANVTLP